MSQSQYNPVPHSAFPLKDLYTGNQKGGLIPLYFSFINAHKQIC